MKILDISSECKNVSLIYLKFKANGTNPNAVETYLFKYPSSPMKPKSNIDAFNRTIFVTESLCSVKKSLNLEGCPSWFKNADNEINIRGVVIAQSR